jgi:hypothetical protein
MRMFAMQFELDPKIVAAFKANGMELTYHPELNEGAGLWDYYADSDVGPIINLWVGINGCNRIGVFGTYDAGYWGGTYSLASNMDEWLECYEKYFMAMKEGRELW